MDVLDQAAEKVYKKLEAIGGNPENLSATLRPIAILYHVQAMIDNGGIRHPLENDLPFQLPYSEVSDSYRAIGANNAAYIFDKAIALIPFPFPERLTQARNEFMDSLGESDEFYKLGNKLCGDESIWNLMNTYVKQHAFDFEILQA